ncbi:thymidylate kinase [Colletotrichum sp. SAR 10_86]|nr:thymidylate kinase [Colletotrichum sp. SAR 10_65]KAI8225435.1 thymidylate kinase [Colletotrichum sp. SAR 10_86]
MASINDLATAAIASSTATGAPAEDGGAPPAGVTRGAFIVFEGLDRSGKTTQVKLLEQRLVELGRKTKAMRFPDRTSPTGNMIDQYLRSNLEMEDHVIHLLFSANRWEAVEYIKSLLASGTTVLCDRYYLSGIVYSAAKQNPSLNLHWARAPELGLPRPDLTLFLDLDESVAKERGGWGGEVYEKAEFQRRVRELFWGLHRGRIGPDGTLGEEDREDADFRQEKEDLVVVDAGASVEEVAEEIWTKVGPRLEAVEKAAANALGTLGAVCWSIQLIPQIIINYRRHNATGLQPSMMMLWAWAGVPLGVYNIVEDFNIALRIQPQILTFLSLATWIQCYYYERNWSVLRSLAVVTPIAAVMAGIQAALVFALRIPKSRGTEWPMIVMAVLSAALLAAGVLRHYWDIYVHRTVRGISFIFVAIDAAGDVFSLASIFFQPSVDILGVIIYATEFVLWCGVFACGGYYNFLPWFRKKMLAKEDAGRPSPAEVNSNHADDVSAGNGIALHDMPSSTSVFRTASGEEPGLRSRAITSRASQIDITD